MVAARLGSRKIIQVSISNPGDGGSSYILALADDGTLWKTRLIANGLPQQGQWVPIQGLPVGELNFDAPEALPTGGPLL